MTLTYRTTNNDGAELSNTQQAAWLSRARDYLRELFPGAEVEVEETDDRSSVSFDEELSGSSQLSEDAVRELLQSEWERFVGSLA